MSKADIAALLDSPNHDGGDGRKMKLLTPNALSAMLTALMPGIERQIATTARGSGICSLNSNLIAKSVLDDKYGILCLAESPTNLLMWAHYADHHRGVAIQFDETHDFFRLHIDTHPDMGLRAVKYSDVRPVRSYSNLESPLTFYTKSTEWSYETEWRFIKPLSEAAKVIDAPGDEPLFPRCLFAVPTDAMTGVILGACMPVQHSEAIVNLLTCSELQHIRVYYAHLSEQKFEIDIHPPLDGSGGSGRFVARAPSAR